MWIVYSLRNRNSWYGSIEKILQISSLLSRRAKYSLSDNDYVIGNLDEWFVLKDEYAKHLAALIDELIEEGSLDEDMALELIRLREVLKGGCVVMG